MTHGWPGSFRCTMRSTPIATCSKTHRVTGGGIDDVTSARSRGTGAASIRLLDVCVRWKIGGAVYQNRNVYCSFVEVRSKRDSKALSNVFTHPRLTTMKTSLP